MENHKIADSRYKNIRHRSFNQSFDIYYFSLLEQSNELNTISLENYISFVENTSQIEKSRLSEIYRKLFQYSKQNDQIHELDNKFTVIQLKKDYDEWEANNLPLIKEMEKHYEEYFKTILPLDKFNEKYGHDEDYEKTCEYCKTKRSEFAKMIESGQIITKRLYSRGRTLEIDRINPNDDYNMNNIVLCCYWCNNAKTDEFSYEDFIEIGKEIRKIWEKRLKSNR